MGSIEMSAGAASAGFINDYTSAVRATRPCRYNLALPVAEFFRLNYHSTGYKNLP